MHSILSRLARVNYFRISHYNPGQLSSLPLHDFMNRFSPQHDPSSRTLNPTSTVIWFRSSRTASMFRARALDILALRFLCSAVAATNLLVSHFSGQIYSLSLSEIGGRNSELIVSSSTTGCGRLPAWLQYDSEIHTAYCVDENWSANGVVASFSVARNGSLTQTGNTTTAGMSVHSAVYGGVNRRSFIVTSE